MRWIVSITLLASALAGARAQTSPPLTDDVLRLARLKQVARQTIARLPSFTCLETIRREHRQAPDAPFHLTDVLQVEVAHTGNREAFAWPGKPFQAAHLSQLVGGALTSDGDFALHARELFFHDNGLFQSAGEDSLAGRPTWRYRFDIPQMWSGWNITVSAARGVVASRGSIWVERESLKVLRFHLDGYDIPPQLPIAAVSTTVDFGPVDIAGAPAWLPQTAETEMTLLRGDTDRNRMEFTHCREFGAESALRFEPDPAATAAVQAPELRLRAGLPVAIRLVTPVDSRTSHPGDRIEAVVDADVRDRKDRNAVVLPKGAKILGRVRRLERFRQPVPYFVVSLEFTTVQVDTRRTAFFAELQRARHAETDLPGVGTFFIDGAEFLLPAGWPMTWRTVTLGR